MSNSEVLEANQRMIYRCYRHATELQMIATFYFLVLLHVLTLKNVMLRMPFIASE